MFKSDTILSLPFEIVWAGWKSDTFTLQREGWQLSVEQDYRRNAFSLAIKHPDFKIYGMTNPMPLHEIAMSRYGERYNRIANFMSFHLGYMCSDLIMHVHGRDLMNFHPVDAEPQRMTEEEMRCYDKIQRISEMPIFKAIEHTKDIIVMPEMVPGLLEKIRECQEPNQARIREEVRKQKDREALRGHIIHAQVVTLAA